MCLSETKCDVIDDDTLPGYKSFTMPKKDVRHRYGGIHGICLFAKTNLCEYLSTINDTVSESVLWVKVNHKAFGIEFVLGSVYLAHEGSDFHSDDIFDNLAEDILRFRSDINVPIILVGDFNSRTSCLDDFVDAEVDLGPIAGIDMSDNDIFNSKGDLEDAGLITERYNADRRTNNNGHRLIELCKSADVKIVNGRFGSDKHIGQFTCFNNTGRSVVDYVIASPALMPLISDFHIEPFDKCLSDAHAPICVTICVPNASCSAGPGESSIVPSEEVTVARPSQNSDLVLLKSKWDPELADQYKKNSITDWTW